MPERAHGMTLASQGLRLPDRRDILAKDIGGIYNGVPAFWFVRAIDTGTAEFLYQPFRDSVWVRAAITKISRPVSSVSVELSTAPASPVGRRRKSARRLYTARGIVRRAEEDMIDMPQVNAFLREPAKGMSWEDFVEASIGWLKMSECFWLLDDSALMPFPDVNKKPFPQIIIARPDRMRHMIENGKLVGWSYTAPSGQSYSLLPEQVIRLTNWNPYDDWRGLGEYSNASVAAEADWLAGKFNRNLMANNGDTGPYIVAKNGIPTDPQREQIIADLRAKRASQLRGDYKPVFLTGDISVQDPLVRSVDAPFISSRLENRHEIAIAFGVPPSMFDVKAAFSIGSASDYFQLIMDTCIPTGAKLCGGLERVIKRFSGREVEVSQNWDEHPTMQQVRRERLQSVDTLANRGMPMKEVSEYLDLELPRYEGWDVGYVPINQTPVTGDEADATPAPQDYDEGGNPSAPAGDNDSETPAPTKSLLSYLRSRLPARQRSASSESLWKQHMRVRLKSVRLYQSKASKIFLEFRAKALRHMASAGEAGKSIQTKSLLDIIFDPQQFGLSLANGLDPIARTVLQTAGVELFAEIGRPDDPWQMAPDAVRKFIASRENNIKGVGETAHNQLKTALTEGIDNGETMDQLTDRVRAVFNKLGKYEARRIAMTETSAAYGYSRHEAMTDAGIEYKGWLSSHGPNVREAHAQAEEDYIDDPIPVDEPFIVDGEDLMYPGDPSGSPENIINCQCIQIAKAKPKEET